MRSGALRRILRVPAVLGAALAAVPLGLAARGGRETWATGVWCRMAARAVGLRIRRRGLEPPPGSLVVLNHVGYLDILALGALAPGRFLAKSEIAAWPLAGVIARWAGTLFVDRDRPRGSRLLLGELARKLVKGDRAVLFAEAGVSADGTTLGDFRPMLFEASVRAGRPVVPAALRYTEPPDPRVWAWIDEPVLWRHLWTRVLPARRVDVEVCFGEPILPGPELDRKALACRAREAVQSLLAE